MTTRPGYHRSFLTALVVVFAAGAMAATTCDDLSKLALPQTAIAMAAPFAPGAFAPPASFSLKLQPGDVEYQKLPAFCRVAATMRPLWRYRKVAVYKGSGSTDDAANFACKVR